MFGDRVDLDASARRELKEETGIDASEAIVAPGWTVVLAPGRIAAMKRMTLPVSAEEAKARIDALLAADPEGRVFAHAYRAKPRRYRRAAHPVLRSGLYPRGAWLRRRRYSDVG